MEYLTGVSSALYFYVVWKPLIISSYVIYFLLLPLLLLLGLLLHNAGFVAEYPVTACDLGYFLPSLLSGILSVRHLHKIPPKLSKVICCKSSMEYGIPNCLSHIPNILKLFPVHRLPLLGWLELINRSKFVWSRILSHSNYRFSQLFPCSLVSNGWATSMMMMIIIIIIIIVMII